MNNIIETIDNKLFNLEIVAENKGYPIEADKDYNTLLELIEDAINYDDINIQEINATYKAIIKNIRDYE